MSTQGKRFYSHLSTQFHTRREHAPSEAHIVKKGTAYLLKLPNAREKYLLASRKSRTSRAHAHIANHFADLSNEDVPLLMEISTLLNRMCHVVSMQHVCDEPENQGLMHQLEQFQQQCWQIERLRKAASSTRKHSTPSTEHQPDQKSSMLASYDPILNKLRKEHSSSVDAQKTSTSSAFTAFGSLTDSGISDAFALRMHDIYQYQMDTVRKEKKSSRG